MKLLDPDYPLSLFREALTSVAGRMLCFFCLCALTVGLFALLVFGLNDGQVTFEAILYGTALSPVFWAVFALAGLLQGWGFISYAALSIPFVLFVLHERPARRTIRSCCASPRAD